MQDTPPFYVTKESPVSQPVQPYGGQQPQVVYVPAPQPKKPLWKRWWFIALAIFLAIGVIGSMTGGGNKGGAAGASAAPSGGGGAAAQGSRDSAGQAAPTAGSGDSGDPSSTTTYNGIQDGDVAVNAGESITAKGVTITSTPLIAGDATLGPTACTGVTIQNASGKEVDFNILEFELLSPSGAIINTGFTGSTNILQSGKLIDGGSTSGDVCFDADVATGGQFVVLYEPLSFFSNHREAWVNKL